MVTKEVCSVLRVQHALVSPTGELLPQRILNEPT
jgi:hypothetical protein